MFAVRMLLIPLAILAISASPAAAAPGKIEKVGSGTVVKITRSGTVIKLKEGDQLQSGDEVSTDAETAVDVRLEDDSLIRLGINSSYKIQEDSKLNALIHRLLSGVVRVLVPKSEHKSSAIKFRMYTPEGTIGVRGTEFVVIRADGKTQLKGLDGEVMFGPAEADYADQGQFVMVSRGFQSAVAGGAKGANKPEKFDLPAYLQEINRKNGIFGPLAARAASTKGYARNNTGASVPALAMTAPASGMKQEVREEKKAPAKDKPPERINWNAELLAAAMDDDVPRARKAVAAGADINSANDVGYTALHVAMLEGKEKAFIYLIAAGADVNAKSKKNGYTPLMLVAAEHLQMKYAESLVKPGGAWLDEPDKFGNTALEMAKANGYKELADYLGSQQSADDAAEAQALKKKHK